MSLLVWKLVQLLEQIKVDSNGAHFFLFRFLPPASRCLLMKNSFYERGSG